MYDHTFSKIDYTLNPLVKGEYEQCNFTQCDFSNTDLSKVVFVDCVFKECNLSSANINQTAFRAVNFIDCKMIGLHFEYCNEFLLSMNFENCVLDLSIFYNRKIKNTKFEKCSLKEVDFTDCELIGSIFSDCDLHRAIFENTNLESVDFSSAYNFNINPDINLIKKAKFNLNGLPGLLTKYDIVIK